MSKRRKNCITELKKDLQRKLANEIIDFAKPKITDYARSNKFTLDTLKGTQHQEGRKIFFKSINLFACDFAKKYAKQDAFRTKQEAQSEVVNDMKKWARKYFAGKTKFRLPFGNL